MWDGVKIINEKPHHSQSQDSIGRVNYHVKNIRYKMNELTKKLSGQKV